MQPLGGGGDYAVQLPAMVPDGDVPAGAGRGNSFVLAQALASTAAGTPGWNC